MSFGHLELYDDAVLPDSLRELTRIEAENSSLLDFMDEDFAFSHKWDIPWVAGRNTTATRVYIDRHCAIIRRLRRAGEIAKGVSIFVSWNVTEFLAIHERLEWYLMTRLGYPYEKGGPRGFGAHHIATAAEYRAVLAAGIDWDSYRREMRKDIKKDDDPRIVKCPPDFDLEPYEEDGNEKLLIRIQSAMGTRRKSAHALFMRR
jgi:hypothetical protein